VVDRFPVLDLGHRPKIKPADWRLTLKGAVAKPVRIGWDELKSLPTVELTCDIHCVTHWSRLDVPWKGVRFRDVLALAGPKPEARFALLHGMDGYSANLPLELVMADDALVAFEVDGKPISTEHGGPVRALVPSRYFWKSSKWLTAISLHTDDEPGFWETRGYHNEGDPFREQRYARGKN
jgi:DMSO/TMAO reductase YedYZ molybdopterin-dependent catalytic subunit